MVCCNSSEESWPCSSLAQRVAQLVVDKVSDGAARLKAIESLLDQVKRTDSVVFGVIGT